MASAALVIIRKGLDSETCRNKARSVLRKEHFSNRYERFLFSHLCQISERYTGEIDLYTFRASVQRRKIPAKHREDVFAKLGELAAIGRVLDSRFEHALESISQDAQRKLYSEALVKIADHVQANRFDQAEEIFRTISQQSNSLGFDSTRRVSARTMGELVPDRIGTRFDTGFEVVDEVTGGGRLSEFWLWAAYQGEFKSTALLSIAHHAFVMGRHCLFISLEMDRDELRRRLLCIHSARVKDPADEEEHIFHYKEIEFQSFPPHIKEQYEELVDDFDNNPLYGDIEIWQPPEGATIEDIRREIEIVGAKNPVDLVLLDYIQLLYPIRTTGRVRDELTETIRRAKSIAMTCRDGKGVWLVSGYQTSTEGRKKAEQQGYYDKWALSETVAAGQSANVVCWSLQTEDLLHRKEVKVGLSKSRNSSIMGSRHYLVADPATGFLSRKPVRKDVRFEDEEEFNLDEIE